MILRGRRTILAAVLTLAVTVSLGSACQDGYFLGEAMQQGMDSPHRPPQWSPQGNLITFTHIRGVYAVQSDGSSVRLLAGGSPEDDFHDAAHSPSMSPNGSRLVYAAYKHDGWLPWSESYRWDIVTSTVDGSDRRRLTDDDNINLRNLNPSWSPDGARIAFLSNRTTLDSSDAEEPPASMSIYTMAPNGSDVRRVAEAPIVAKAPLLCGLQMGEPSRLWPWRLTRYQAPTKMSCILPELTTGASSDLQRCQVNLSGRPTGRALLSLRRTKRRTNCTLKFILSTSMVPTWSK